MALVVGSKSSMKMDAPGLASETWECTNPDADTDTDYSSDVGS